MKHSTVLIEIIANPLYLLLMFLAVLSILHFVLVSYIQLDDRAWKKVDYVWLGIAVLGLLAASAKADTYLSRIHLKESVEPFIDQRLILLRSFVKRMSTDGSTLCRNFIKSDFSPDNFEEIIEIYQQRCEEIKNINRAFADIDNFSYPSPEELEFVKLKGEREHVEWMAGLLDMYVNDYRKAYAEWTVFSKSNSPSVWEEILIIIGPLLLALALALRITKVSGELANSRKKDVNK